MKNLNLRSQTTKIGSADASLATGHLEFNDIMIYQEMGDQTSVRLNLIEQIHAQINQLDEMVSRKNFVMNEICNEIVK